MIAKTPRTFSPKASAFSMAASELPPVVTTSSTMTTASPGRTERYLAAVEIVARHLPRGEFELPDLQGEPAHQVHEGVLVVHPRFSSDKNRAAAFYRAAGLRPSL